MDIKNKKLTKIFIPRATFYFLIIFVLISTIAVLNWEIALLGYVLFIILIFYNIRLNKLRQREVAKYIQNLTFNIDKATKDTLLNFPMPLVVSEFDGTIIWNNSSFNEIFTDEKFLQSTITSLVKDINNSITNKEVINTNREIVVKNRNFCIFSNFIKIDHNLSEDNFIFMFFSYLLHTQIL